MVFQVIKIEPPRTPTFDEIKDRVALEFKGQRAGDLLKRKTQELADRAHAEHDLAKAAKEAGVPLQTSELIGRTQNVPDIGSMGGQAGVAFSMKEGEISGPLNLGASQGVLQIVQRQDPSPTDPEFAKSRDQLREKLMEEKRQEVIGLFLSSLNQRLRKEGKIKEFKNPADASNRARG